MMTSSWIRTAFFAAALSACGGTRSAAQPPESPLGAESEGGDSPELANSTDAQESPTAATEQERTPVPAATSLPAGLVAWTDAEREELEKACRPLMDAIVKKANRDRERPDRTEAALHALKDPPNVKGLDMTRCSEFVRQQLVSYRAKSIESEAIINIKRIVVGLADASQAEPGRLCPSAPPVPMSLDAVREGPHQAPPNAWGAEGWKCVRFQLGGAPQRFQYEVVTDPQVGTYRIVARGFPVPGHGPEELFLAGKTEDGRVTPSSAIMRKMP